MSDSHSDFETLLPYLQDALPADQCQAIEKRLSEDAAFRNLYLEMASEEMAIHRRAQSEQIQKDLDHHLFGESKSPTGAWAHAGWWTALAACLVAVLSIVWAIQSPSSPVAGHQDPLAQNPNPDHMGHLISEAAAIFQEGKGPDGRIFKPGAYALKHGAAHIQLASGVDLALRAPTKFTIIDPLHVKLTHGAMRATVPEKAKGFVITSPKADVEDLGTEFGVRVDEITGISEVHVFEGEVNLRKSGGGAIQSMLRGGEAVQLDAEGQTTTHTLDPAPFATRNAVEMDRWQLWAQKLQADPTVLCHYDFARDASVPNVLRDRSKSKLDGAIQGARWSTGRWIGKSALLFDTDADAVQLNIPGHYDAMTIAAWVKIDRFEGPIGVLLRSDDYTSPGSVRFFTSRRNHIVNGSVRNAVVGYPRKKSGKLIPSGRWAHLVVVFDFPRGECRSYLNGKASSQRVLKPGRKLHLGPSHIAAWASPKEAGYGWPPFRGRMDELVIWKRALNRREIGHIYAQTKTIEILGD